MVGIPGRGKYLEIYGIIISDYRGIYLTNVCSQQRTVNVPSSKNVCLKWIIWNQN